MAELGIGLSGCGNWGRHLADVMQHLDGARMVAVQDPDLSTAQEYGSSLGAPAYATHQELLADSNVDAVLVANPHSMHEEAVVAAAKAGKHIFCDKPLGINISQCYRMIEAAEKNGVKLMCGQVTRLYPVYNRAARIAKSGRLGRLAAINLTNLVHINRVRWWARSETMGTLLHSPAVHMIDYLLFVCGKATSVYAVEPEVRVQEGVDYQDTAFLQIQFENGAIGGIQSSVSCLISGNRCHMIGDRGSLRFDAGAEWIEFASWEGKRERIGVGTFDSPRSQSDIGVHTELQNFIDWITQDAEPILNAWDGLRAVEIIDAAYLSIAEKRPIGLPLPRP